MSLSYGLRPIFESLAYQDALSLSDTSQVQNYSFARWTAKTGKAHQRCFLSPIYWLRFQVSKYQSRHWSCAYSRQRRPHNHSMQGFDTRSVSLSNTASNLVFAVAAAFAGWARYFAIVTQAALHTAQNHSGAHLWHS